MTTIITKNNEEKKPMYLHLTREKNPSEIYEPQNPRETHDRETHDSPDLAEIHRY